MALPYATGIAPPPAAGPRTMDRWWHVILLALCVAVAIGRWP
jgi:hypothetical protein